LGGAKVNARLEKIERFLGDHGGDKLQELRRHDCGSVILRLSQPIALSSFYDNASLGRFVMVDGYNAAGGGIVLEALESATEEQANLKIRADFEDELFAFLKVHFPHRFPDPGAGI
jgi:bifunctional enzyme CysN/CysC/sulfate adenylyltransferase subunit 1